jgi:DNA mismatch repair protein MutL
VSIQILPEQLINQIAAGEVVERPAAVIKELVENSLDAGARRIEIEVEQGGLGLMRVRDDGAGIARDQLALALQRHATSKIASLDDLERVASFGFRGEALPSIAAVSRFALTSRTSEDAHGWSVTGAGLIDGALPKAMAHPPGTTIEVRDLFFNTPARRKFMRAESTELRHIEQLVRRLALSRFDLQISLKHNGRHSLDLNAAEQNAGSQNVVSESDARASRIAAVLGKEFLANAVPLDETRPFIDGDLRLWGWAALPSFARSQTDFQYLYVNGRMVRDKLLGHALRRAYADALHSTRHPAFVLYLELDPAGVDVNVHPAKSEVRFRRSSQVHDFLLGCVHQLLRQVRPQPALHHRVPIGESFRESFDNTPRQTPFAYRMAPNTNVYDEVRESAPSLASSAWPLYGEISQRAKTVSESTDSASTTQTIDADSEPLGRAIAQLHGIFILAENALGLVIVDAHAAHERVIYERFKTDMARGGVASQSLLMPQMVNVGEAGADHLEAQSAQLSQLGLTIDRAGPESVRVRAVPPLLARADLDALLQSLARDDTDGLGHFDEALDAQRRVLADMACRAAIKAHRKMTLPEMDALLRDMERTDLAGQCNHGRPTWVQIGANELDRLFLRGH